MHLRAREKNYSSRRREQPQLRIQLHRLLWLRLLARVTRHMLGGFLPTRAVPFGVVVIARSVSHRAVPVGGVKCHGVGREDWIDRQPPIDLTHRSRVPGVAVWMESVCDSRGQIILTRRCPHPRNVEVRLLGITSEVGQNFLKTFLRPWVVDELR